MSDNQSLFSTSEFEQWAKVEADKAVLAPEEQFLIERYFDKNARTIEAGTGGGRIMLALQKLGFSNLTGFDYIPESIELARKRDAGGSIQFDVQNAVHLTYAAGAFDQAIYAEQIISLIENEADRKRAVEEACRVLKSGSPALFSVLSLDSRQQSRFYRSYLTFLQVLRRLKRSNRPVQSQPWLRLGGKMNLRAALDSGPYVYWYRTQEFLDLLTAAGFEIIGFGTSRQLKAGQLCNSVFALQQEPLSGHLFVMARRS
jgi:ubiquinone/menaquinone biosynthesis C-methylase UbiE